MISWCIDYHNRPSWSQTLLWHSKNWVWDHCFSSFISLSLKHVYYYYFIVLALSLWESWDKQRNFKQSQIKYSLSSAKIDFKNLICHFSHHRSWLCVKNTQTLFKESKHQVKAALHCYGLPFCGQPNGRPPMNEPSVNLTKHPHHKLTFLASVWHLLWTWDTFV